MIFLLGILWTFFKVGAFTFGGGYAMIPLIHAEAVEKARWLTTQEFLDAIAVSQVSPGPFAILATFIGFRAGGIPGAVMATLGIFLPSLVAGWGILRLQHRFKDNPVVAAVWAGMRAAVVGLLLGAVVRLGASSLHGAPAFAVAAGAFAVALLRLPPLAVLGAAAAAGLVMARL
ncbi:MAG: chromate transporter [Armatimonadetes bacterium]|nr:chromate transporter [Armatimonadota bacterium]